MNTSNKPSIKFTVLGCDAGFPDAGGACSGFLLEHGGRHLLVDCGAGVLARLLSVTDMEGLDGVVLTHLHFDHMSDAFTMAYRIKALREAGMLSRQIPLLLPDEPSNLAALFDSGEFVIHHFNPNEPQVFGGWHIECLSVHHAVSTYAVRITNINVPDAVFAYTSDTDIVPELPAFCKNADLLLASAPYLLRDWKPGGVHMNSRAAGELALAANAKRLIITHRNHFPNISAKEIEEAKSVFINTDGAAAGETFVVKC
jgi:ribonuclease BN (tRNA processing enzyme)